MATTKVKYMTPKAIQDEAGRRVNRVFDELANLTFMVHMNRKHVGPREMEILEKEVEKKDFRVIGLDLIITVPINFN